MAKYIFDMRSGHYHSVLNEDEQLTAQQQNNLQQQPTDNKNNNQELTANLQQNNEQPNMSNVLPNLENSDVVALNQTKINEIKRLDQQLQIKQQNITQLQQQLADATTEYNNADDTKKESNRENIIKINSKLLLVQLEIARLTKQKADVSFKYDERILKVKQTANESLLRAKLPEKYKYLTESNISSAKIYMKNLIANDDEHILKGMHDFKRAFADSELLYGKDKEGFFVVCVDQQDFDRTYDTLEEIGYLRDEIFDTIMPQLFNRQEMVI